MSACPLPYIENNDSVENYCYKPCEDDKYLYWNNSCLQSCNLPFISTEEEGINICSLPCEPSEYFYESSQSCSSLCDPPNVRTTLGFHQKVVLLAQRLQLRTAALKTYLNRKLNK